MRNIKKSFSRAFWVFFIVSGLLLVSANFFGTVHASTVANGIISSDTIWTKTNSPYTFTGPVKVDLGVTLTIEPGVTVDIGDYYFEVGGTLSARGSINDKIIFSSTGSSTVQGDLIFYSSSVSWDEQTNSGCIIENAVLNLKGRIFLYDTSPKITLSTINCDITFEKYSTAGRPIISDNMMTGGIFIQSGSPIIVNNTISAPPSPGAPTTGISLYSKNISNPAIVSNNTISDCYFGISGITNAIVSNNVITDCEYGMDIKAAGNASVSNNIISGCRTVGIHFESGYLVIENNTITDNFNGISIRNPWADYYSFGDIPAIKHNNIYANTNYNIDSGATNDIDATSNWWGTTDPQIINQTIHDIKNDYHIGKIDFVPFLTEPNPEAIPIPEFPSWIILPLLLIATLLITIFSQKLTRQQRILGD